MRGNGHKMQAVEHNPKGGKFIYATQEQMREEIRNMEARVDKNIEAQTASIKEMLALQTATLSAQVAGINDKLEVQAKNHKEQLQSETSALREEMRLQTTATREQMAIETRILKEQLSHITATSESTRAEMLNLRDRLTRIDTILKLVGAVIVAGVGIVTKFFGLAELIHKGSP